METLPFEYGFLYKPVVPTEEADRIAMQDKVKVQNDYVSFYNQGYGMMSGSVSFNGIDDKYFHPIGFIASEQIVVAEVMVSEIERTSGHLQMSNMSFQTTILEKNYKKIARVHIDVNIFIKHFEKVL